MANTTNKQNALALVPTFVNALQNEDLRKQTITILKCDKSIEADVWRKAKAIYRIYEDKLYETDYVKGGFSAYAEAMGDSKSEYSKSVNAWRFINSETAKKYGFTIENLIKENAYILSTIKDTKTEKGVFEDFIEFTNGTDLTKLSHIQMVKLKKEFYDSRKAIDVNAKVVESEEAEAKTKAENKKSSEADVELVGMNIFEVLNDSIVFTYDNNKYIIPIEALAQFKQTKAKKNKKS